jgi:hypothetical protein
MAMDPLIFTVSICGLMAIYIGAVTNSFVIIKLIRRRRTINDVFPLNMASFLWATVDCTLKVLIDLNLFQIAKFN